MVFDLGFGVLFIYYYVVLVFAFALRLLLVFGGLILDLLVICVCLFDCALVVVV